MDFWTNGKLPPCLSTRSTLILPTPFFAECTGLRDLGDEPNPRQQVRRPPLVPAVQRPPRSPAAIARPPPLGSAGSADGSGPSAVRAVSQVREFHFGICPRVAECWIKCCCCLHFWFRCTNGKTRKLLIRYGGSCLPESV